MNKRRFKQHSEESLSENSGIDDCLINTENYEQDGLIQKHLKGFTNDERKMIKLMAQIFVQYVVTGDTSAAKSN